MGELTRDLRHGLRLLRREPVVSVAMVATMVLAIGAISAVASLVYGVLVRPLPFPDSGRIVQIARTIGRTPPPFRAVGLPDTRDWRSRSTTLAEVAGWTTAGATLVGDGEPQRVVLAEVTEGFERVLGVAPALGRFFRSSEFTPETSRVLVLSHGFWSGRLGRDPDVVGRTLVLDGVGHTVVGVLPDLEAEYPPVGFDAWRPLAPGPDHWSLQVRGASWMNAVGRVRPAVDVETAQVEMERIQSILVDEFPRQQQNQSSVLLEPLRDVLSAPARESLTLLSGVVAIILLLACANLTLLLLARASRRTTELAIRSALGGTAGRIRRQLLAEALVVGGVGGVLGVLAAPWALGTIVALYPGGLPRAGEVGVDWPIVAAAGVIVILTAIAGSVLPGSWGLGRGLRVRPGAHDTGRGGRLRESLVAVQVAVSVLLLVGSALFVQTLRNLSAIDPGFDGEGVTAFRVSPAAARYPDPPSLDSYYAEVLARLDALPGMRSTGYANFVPFASGEWGHTFRIVGDDSGATEAAGHPANVRIASPGYYETLRVPLVRGRLFDGRDGRAAARVVMLNETAARNAFAGSDPVGRLVEFEGEVREVVGVVGDVRHHTLSEPPSPEIHLPVRQMPLDAAWVVVGAGPAGTPVAALRQALREVDPTVAPVGLAGYDERLSDAIAAERFRAALVTALGTLAVAMALLGVYATVSNLVTRRIREIGIRIALGEGGGSVVLRVLARAALISGIGVAAGVATTALLASRVADLLFGVGAADTPTYLGVSLLVWAVSVLAALAPSMRASATDPAVALRAD